jgi:hypothetical protein
VPPFAVAGTANAASTAAAHNGRTIRTRRKSAKKPDERAEIVMVFLLGAEPQGGGNWVVPRSPLTVHYCQNRVALL